MKKIGIITLNGYFNYGNRLQNFALQESLKKYNFEVETVWIEKDRINNKAKSNKLQTVVKNPKSLIKKVYTKAYLNPLNEKRKFRFKQFSNQFINETTTSISEANLPTDLLNEYDYFVTGSDQVWNPYFTNASSLYFLTFAPREKRIAYSPSFGISEIPTWCESEFKEWLKGMEHISVREDAGAEIIRNLTGREAEVLADPTLLLSKESWLSIAKPFSNKPKESYLLTYFLGEIPVDTKILINDISNKYNLKVVNLAQVKQRKYYLTDPAEFLDFINSATLFFTDSFHGSVFSLLFETPFVITDRKGSIPSMNSRIQTLLSKYGLEDRHISKIDDTDIFNVDFTHVETILNDERSKANEYLANALNK